MKIDATLMTLCGLIADRDDVEPIPAQQISRIIASAQHHGLAPILAQTLKQSGIRLADHPHWKPLQEELYRGMAEAAIMEKSFHHLIADFDKGNIPAVWLKGAALAPTIYADWSLRPMSDLDVLVPYDLRDEALRIAKLSGYDFYQSDAILFDGQEAFRPANHHFHLLGGVGQKVHLEIHYWLLDHDHSALLSDEGLAWFLDQTETCRHKGRSFQILNPEAHLLYLCAHAILQHGEADFYALRFWDLRGLINTYSLKWEIILERAIALNWAYPVMRGLKITQELYSTSVPEAILEKLESATSNDPFTRYAIMISGKGSRAAKLSRTLRRTSWKGRVLLVYRILIPPRAYMRNRYHIKANWPVFPYYLFRWLNQGIGAGWAIFSHLRFWASDRRRKRDQ